MPYLQEKKLNSSTTDITEVNEWLENWLERAQ